MIRPPHRVISRGAAAGSFQAFPDVCRLANGELLAAFYAGYAHISLPNEAWPRGGRLCVARSADEGRSWSEPAILYDGVDDNRDPHLCVLPDGGVLCSFFDFRRVERDGVVSIEVDARCVRSSDGGRTFDRQAEPIALGYACSAPPRRLRNGVILQCVYAERLRPRVRDAEGKVTCVDDGRPWAHLAVVPLRWGSWRAPVIVPGTLDGGVLRDATEADIVELRDGRLLLVVRSDEKCMHRCESTDGGRSWSRPVDMGFVGHCPQLLMLRSGTLVLTQRYPGSALRLSADEGATWSAPFQIDPVGGAYPAAVELSDGSVLVVYYEEGAGSAVCARRFALKGMELEWLDERGASLRRRRPRGVARKNAG